LTQQQAKTPAVLYAAKSTEDKRGSIPTQLEQGREMAGREGWQTAAEFSDEAFSAYSGNRGPGLERAKTLAAKIAREHGRCILVAQDADRFARGAGDAPGAADHLGEVYFAMKRHGVELWTVRSGHLDLLRAAIEGERSHDESARKTQAVKAGLQRRKERGSPVGAVPLGYTVEKRVADGEVLTSRVIDNNTLPTVERIFDLVEAGSTFGDVARVLNAEGIPGRRGKPWTARTVRKIVHNRAYVGEKGYPAISELERFEAIQAALKRLDPVQLAKRKGGRKPVDESFFLRGLLFCSSCGGAMYTRRQSVGRVYVCRERRQCTGLCDAPVVPAELIESHVLRHLDTFIGSVEGWIAERLEERQSEGRQREAALVRARAKLADLDRLRDRAYGMYRQLLDEGASTAPLALEEVERIDRERSEQEHAIEQAEAVVSEWSGAPDVDAALDFYNGLVEFVQGRIQKAEGARELHDSLSTVVAALWAEMEEDRERLLVEFELLRWRDGKHFLPPRALDDRLLPESPWREREIACEMERAMERADRTPWPLSKPGPTPSYRTSQ
jgi:DNA invertase Pin-like site-specific DNA recombinase